MAYNGVSQAWETSVMIGDCGGDKIAVSLVCSLGADILFHVFVNNSLIAGDVNTISCPPQLLLVAPNVVELNTICNCIGLSATLTFTI